MLEQSRAVGQGDMVIHSLSSPGLSPSTEVMASTAKPNTFAGPVVSEDNGKDQGKLKKGCVMLGERRGRCV